MSTLLQADIFFFISSIGVVLATVAFIVAAVAVTQAAREVRMFVASIRTEFEELREERRRAASRIRFFGRWMRNIIDEYN